MKCWWAHHNNYKFIFEPSVEEISIPLGGTSKEKLYQLPKSKPEQTKVETKNLLMQLLLVSFLPISSRVTLNPQKYVSTSKWNSENFFSLVGISIDLASKCLTDFKIDISTSFSLSLSPSFYLSHFLTSSLSDFLLFSLSLYFLTKQPLLRFFICIFSNVGIGI